MKDLIVKWWCRKWSDWEHYRYLSVFREDADNIPYQREEILVRYSNDGLKQYKQVIIG